MPPFQGTFSNEIRLALRLKRQKLHVSRNALANFLGIDAVTLLRWEQGPTRHCIRELQPLVQNFLEGAFDKELTKRCAKQPPTPFPEEIQADFAKIIQVYLACQGRPELQKKILEEIQKYVHTLPFHNSKENPTQQTSSTNTG